MRPSAARLVVLALTLLATASGPRADSWDREYLIGEEVAGGFQHELIATSDGGALVHDELVSGDDVLLMRLDSDGAVDWRVRLESPFHDIVHDVTETPDGGFLVVGWVNALLPLSQSFVVKLDSAGGITWEKRFDGLDTAFISEVIALEDGGCLLFGTTRTPTGVSGIGWMARLDATGDVTWARTYASGDSGLNLPRARRVPGGGPTVLTDDGQPAIIVTLNDDGRLLREGVLERLPWGHARVHDLLVTPGGDVVVMGVIEALDPCGFDQYESWLALIRPDDTLAWSVRTPDAWFTSIVPMPGGLATSGGVGPCDMGLHEGWATWDLAGTVLSARTRPGRAAAGAPSTGTTALLAGPPAADPWQSTSIHVRKVELDGSGCPSGVDAVVTVLPLDLAWTARPVLTLTDFVPVVTAPAFVVTPFATTDTVSACGVPIPDALLPPDEVPRLDVERLASGAAALTWEPAPRASTHEVHVASPAASAAVPPEMRLLAGACGLTADAHVDIGEAADGVRWYVVAGRNAAGLGSLGFDSLGRDRGAPAASCP